MSDIRPMQEREARLATLDAAIARGLADADRVRAVSEVFDRLEAKYRAQAESKGGDAIGLSARRQPQRR